MIRNHVAAPGRGARAGIDCAYTLEAALTYLLGQAIGTSSHFLTAGSSLHGFFQSVIDRHWSMIYCNLSCGLSGSCSLPGPRVRPFEVRQIELLGFGCFPSERLDPLLDASVLP